MIWKLHTGSVICQNIICSQQSPRGYAIFHFCCTGMSQYSQWGKKHRCLRHSQVYRTKWIKHWKRPHGWPIEEYDALCCCWCCFGLFRFVLFLFVCFCFFSLISLEESRLNFTVTVFCISTRTWVMMLWRICLAVSLLSMLFPSPLPLFLFLFVCLFFVCFCLFV